MLGVRVRRSADKQSTEHPVCNAVYELIPQKLSNNYQNIHCV